jgi:hypothetical protein
MWWFLSLQLAAFAPPPAAAVDAAPTEAEPFLHSAERCPALFGGARRRAANREARQEQFFGIAESDHSVSVTHSSPTWRTPDSRRIGGLRVLGVVIDPASGEDAIRVRIENDVGGHCPAGDYAVRIDDALGSDARVLALTSGGLVVEHKSELAVLPREGTPPVHVRMIWRSPFSLAMSGGGAGGGSTKAGTSSSATRPSTRERAKADAKETSASAREQSKAVARDSLKRVAPTPSGTIKKPRG